MLNVPVVTFMSECVHVCLTFLCVTVVKDLVLIPVHTKPEDSQKELDELHDVVDAIRKKWRTNVGLIVTNTRVNVGSVCFYKPQICWNFSLCSVFYLVYVLTTLFLHSG